MSPTGLHMFKMGRKRLEVLGPLVCFVLACVALLGFVGPGPGPTGPSLGGMSDPQLKSYMEGLVRDVDALRRHQDEHGTGGGTAADAKLDSINALLAEVQQQLESLEAKIAQLHTTPKPDPGGNYHDRDGVNLLLLKTKHRLRGLSEAAALQRAEQDLAVQRARERNEEIKLDRVTVAVTGQCLDSTNTRGEEGTLAFATRCYHDYWTQTWRLTPQGRVQDDKGICLDFAGLGVGDQVRALPCSDSSAEQGVAWEPAGRRKSVGFLRATASGLCLQIKSADAAVSRTPEPVLLQECNLSCNQLWYVLGQVPALPALLPPAERAPAPKGALADHPHGAAGSRQPRVVCWVMTNPKNHATKATAVNRTWGQDCDTLLFMTTEGFPGLRTVELDIGNEESRPMLWRKSILAWTHLYMEHLQDGDWFMRADDDSYLMMDNLRTFLRGYDANEPLLFGRWLNDSEINFFSGGASTVISRAALQRLGDQAKQNPYDVFKDWDSFADDLEIGASFAELNVRPSDSRDAEQRERFFTIGVFDERHITRREEPSSWYFRMNHFRPREGRDCCSPTWISTHYTTPHRMAFFEDMHAIGCEAAGQQPWDATVRLPDGRA